MQLTADGRKIELMDSSCLTRRMEGWKNVLIEDMEKQRNLHVHTHTRKHTHTNTHENTHTYTHRHTRGKPQRRWDRLEREGRRERWTKQLVARLPPCDSDEMLINHQHLLSLLQPNAAASAFSTSVPSNVAKQPTYNVHSQGASDRLTETMRERNRNTQTTRCAYDRSSKTACWLILNVAQPLISNFPSEPS